MKWKKFIKEVTKTKMQVFCWGFLLGIFFAIFSIMVVESLFLLLNLK